jgi:type IX secretion system substrate protein
MEKIIKLALFFFLVNSSFAQLSREWTRFYDNVEEGNFSQVLTYDNYIYVFGEAMNSNNLDYLIIKYSQSGEVIWAHTYDVVHYLYGSLYDNFLKATIDANGNLYVTGISTILGHDFDIGIIKVSPDGELQWAGVYLGGNGDEGPTDIRAVSDGILLVGTSPQAAGYSDMLTVKISFDGYVMSELRFIRELFTNNGGGTACIVNNDIYVSGWSRAPESYDIVLVKYNWGLGGETWRRFFDVSNDNSKGYEVVADDGYLYVVGAGGAYGGSVPILKYDFNGNLIWYRFHQVPEAEINRSPHIKLDNDNIYVIYSSNEYGRVFKYNKNGDFMWVRIQKGPIWSHYRSFDIDNRYIYISGDEGWHTGIVKVYDLDGNDVFYDYIAGNSGALYDIIKSGTNVFTTGVYWEVGWPNDDAVTIKYNVLPDGGFDKAQKFNKLVKSNSGITWCNNLTSPETQMLQSADSLTDSLMVGSRGEIYRTTNNGINWYIVGKSKINGESKLLVNDVKTSLIPSKFKLYQNYPNPFNPVTNLRFDISELRFVKLIVYDILGNAVETILNEELKPGTYEVTFSAANYSSGIYYYKLIAGEFTDTKKMVLVK